MAEAFTQFVAALARMVPLPSSPLAHMTHAVLSMPSRMLPSLPSAFVYAAPLDETLRVYDTLALVFGVVVVCCWLAGALTGNYSKTDQIWSIMPAVCRFNSATLVHPAAFPPRAFVYKTADKHTSSQRWTR
jgi:hypothetical protein